jgi:CubicO group peptidase (beta-lactamase class C family)
MRRMKHKAFSLLVLLALLLGLAACSGKATPIPSPTDPMQTFEQEVEHLRKELKIPGMSGAVIQEQEVKGTKLIWHYGYAPGAYSSLILKVPEEEVTLIFLANSDGASAGFYLGDGDVFRSPFAVAFLNLFTDLEVE